MVNFAASSYDSNIFLNVCNFEFCAEVQEKFRDCSLKAMMSVLPSDEIHGNSISTVHDCNATAIFVLALLCRLCLNSSPGSQLPRTCKRKFYNGLFRWYTPMNCFDCSNIAYHFKIRYPFV